MKLKSYRSLLIIVLAVICVGILINSVFSNMLTEDDSDELEDIENAIIIKGIEHNGDTVFEELCYESENGMIIYDNSFSNLNSGNAVGINFFKENKKNNTSKNNLKDTYSGINFIKQLKTKDNKWHLTSHKIQKGENLWEIAKKYKTDYRYIIKANTIKNPDMLNPGKIIDVPNKNGLDHKIRKNETLSEIAKLYNIKQDVIIANNDIRKNLIIAGDSIFIPDAAVKKQPAQNIVRKKNFKENKYDQQENNTDHIYAKNNSLLKFMRPLKGKVSSAFGHRINPITKKRKFHCGMDISAPIGTPVKASAKGKCIFSGWKSGYGRVVILKHDKGYITVYAHNKENIIKTGDRIDEGKIIALSGMSGAVTGPHLHFEIRKYLTPLNPARFIK